MFEPTSTHDWFGNSSSMPYRTRKIIDQRVRIWIASIRADAQRIPQPMPIEDAPMRTVSLPRLSDSQSFFWVMRH